MSFLAKRKFILKDALAKRRKIQDNNTALKGDKEVLLSKVKNLGSELEERRKEVGALGVELDSALEEIKSLNTLAENFTSDQRGFLVEGKALVENFLVLLKKLDEKVEKQFEVLEDAKQKVAENRKIIVIENEVLGKRKADLNIFKGRLEKYFKEHLPDQKIIL